MSFAVGSNHVSAEANNLLVIAAACIAVGWFVKLCRDYAQLTTLKMAFRDQRVIRVDGIGQELRDIGTVQHSHFRELMRTRRAMPEPVTVERVQVPFRVQPSLLSSHTIGLPSGEPGLGITLKFDATRPCAVQAFWGVRFFEPPSNPRENKKVSGTWCVRLASPNGRLLAEPNPATDVSDFIAGLFEQSGPGSSEAAPSRSIGSKYTALANQSPADGLHLFGAANVAKQSRIAYFDAGEGLEYRMDAADAVVMAPVPSVVLTYSRLTVPTSFPLVVALCALPAEDDDTHTPLCELVCIEFEVADGLELLRAFSRASRGKVAAQLAQRRRKTDQTDGEGEGEGEGEGDGDPEGRADKSKAHPAAPKPSIVKTLCATPGAVYDMQEVFGTKSEGEDTDCVICLSEPSDTILLPCRHMCVCSECFGGVDKCPICRADYTGFLRCHRDDDDDGNNQGEEGGDELV